MITNKVKLINGYLNYTMIILFLVIKPVSRIIGFITYNGYIFESLVNYFILFCLIIYLFLNSKRILKFKNVKVYNFALFTLIYIFAVYFCSYFVVIKYGYIYLLGEKIQIISIKEYYFSFLKQTMFFFIVFWIIGANIENIIFVMNKRVIKNLNVILYLLFVIVLISVGLKQNLGSMNTIFTTHENEMYLFIGDTFSIFSLIFFNILKNRYFKMLMCLNSIYWLYKIGSRTSLYLYILVIGVFFIKYFIKVGFNKKILIISISIICIILSVLSLTNILKYNGFLSSDNRMMRGIVSISEDGSFQSRLVEFGEGFIDIKQFWFTGRLFREIERYGYPGEYMHNIFSYWVEFGLIPFGNLMVLTIMLLINNFKMYFKYENNTEVNLVFCTTLFIIMSVFLSRSYIYPYIWFVLSCSIKMRYSINETES